MRNLKVSCIKNAKFNLQVLSYCFDPDNGVTYILSNLFEIYTVAANETNPILFQTVEASGKVISFEYWVEARGILLILEDGHIILSRKELNKQLYKHESRISSVALSPCQDLLSLVDENYNIQLMSASDTDFHVIHKLNSLETNDSLNKPVGVGWGSKETQFFGLDGRQTQKKEPERVFTDEELRECQEIESSDEFIKFKKSQEKTISMDWRGDGQLLATLSFLPDLNKHCLKVWNKRLELQYMSEKLIEIERGILSYVPDGQFISCAQRRESKVSEVTFFEKNGLVRHGFSLPSLLKNCYIQAMAWSPNSEILALIVKQFVKIDAKICTKNIMLLYTMRNWHYYLKLSCYLENNCDYGVRWNPNITSQLHLLTSNGHYTEYDICSRVDYSEDQSAVYVIDGNKILVTPLQDGVIPPPMFKYKLEYDDLIYKIGTYSENFTALCILTMTGRVLLSGEFSQDMSTLFYNEDDLYRDHDWQPTYLSGDFGTVDFGAIEDVTLIQHIVPYINEYKARNGDPPSILGSRISQSGCELINIQLSFTEPAALSIQNKYDNQQVMGISPFNHKYHHICSLILRDGSKVLWHYPHKFEKKNQLISPDDKSSSYTVLDLRCIGPSCISLAKNLCLSIDDSLIAVNSCTSFRMTDNFIVYTTTDNQLQFLHKQELEFQGCISDDLLYSQPIENGGFLISASEVDSKVVLQMPRGNLETIYPRLFILSRIMSMIEKSDYVDACKLAKRHRVNMNFLVDFIMRIEKSHELTKFIHAVGYKDPSLLCIVLTELDNSDTISGRYGSIIYHIPTYQPMVEDATKLLIEDKVNNFCKIVSQLQCSELLQPRLQSLIKMEPKQTEEALKIIFNLENETSRQDAIKFMLYFIDIEELFKSSLCTYNTNITLMVAATSNKDPKQYLSFINEIDTSGEVIELKHYKIDLYVKRYDEAFKNLFSHRVKIEKENSPDELAKIDEELIDLVTSKKLYRVAVRVMEEEKGFKSLKASIWSNYADYLLQKRHYEESGWAYSKAYTYSGLRKNYDLALISYAFVNSWQKSIAFIARSSIEQPVKVGSLEKIAKTLFESGQYENGCFVMTGMDSDNLDEVVPTLLDSPHWYMAEFVSGEKKMKQFSEQIKSSIIRHLETFLDDTRKEVSHAQQRLARLESIQRKQLEKPKEIVQYISDTVSTVDGSEVSSLSQSSQATSRTKSGATSIKTRCSAKSVSNNKKRITLKEGSRYEDLALIVELKLFLSKQATIQAEASKLISSVFEYCPLDYASSENTTLHRLLSESLEQSNKILEKLWPPVESDCESLSVVKRLERHFLSTGISTTLGSLENVDFEVCIKPDLPKQVTCFDV